MLCQLQRHFVVPTTTAAAHGYRTYANLLAPSTALEQRDQAWVANLTYIRLPTCFVYLACLLDAYSRCVVRWKLSRRLDTALTLAALELALARRQPAPGLIHHSNRGVQYANMAYMARWEQVGT